MLDFSSKDNTVILCLVGVKISQENVFNFQTLVHNRIILKFYFRESEAVSALGYLGSGTFCDVKSFGIFAKMHKCTRASLKGFSNREVPQKWSNTQNLKYLSCR